MRSCHGAGTGVVGGEGIGRGAIGDITLHGPADRFKAVGILRNIGEGHIAVDDGAGGEAGRLPGPDLILAVSGAQLARKLAAISTTSSIM